MEYTPEQYIEVMRKRLKAFQESQALNIAVSGVISDMVERIFENGLDSNESSIGSYSGSELYVNPNKVRKKFPTKGKTGKDTFANGEKHKTGYFDTYAEFKKSQGQPDKVNLVLTGSLRNDFSKAPIVANDAIEVRVNELNYQKIQGNEDRFGKAIFTPSEKEIERMISDVKFEMTKYLNGND